MKKWLLYVIVLCLAVYWLSNLILWFPWSYRVWLGMTLMLTVSPIVWTYATIMALKTFPNKNKYQAAFIIALSFLSISMISDYIFFGFIRNAMDQLYHPTTWYGYAFVFCFPFILAFLYRTKSNVERPILCLQSFEKPLTFFLVSLVSIVLIIYFDIRIE